MGFSFVWYLFWWCFGFDFVGFVVGRFAWFGWVCVIVSWFYVYCDYWCGFCLSLYGAVLGGFCMVGLCVVICIGTGFGIFVFWRWGVSCWFCWVDLWVLGFRVLGAT